MDIELRRGNRTLDAIPIDGDAQPMDVPNRDASAISKVTVRGIDGHIKDQFTV